MGAKVLWVSCMLTEDKEGNIRKSRLMGTRYGKLIGSKAPTKGEYLEGLSMKALREMNA